MKIKSVIPWLMFLSLYLSLNNTAIGQSNVCITIDDVPNTKQFQSDNYQSVLLDKLDDENIPIAIFINEGLIYKTDAIAKNFELLTNWIKKDFVLLGNHTFAHSRYSEVGFESFKKDVEKGHYITRELAKKKDKSLSYFRFPYNDLGKDSIQHIRMDSLLKTNNYISTPFTVESSDWMFNYIYNHYLANAEMEKAREIGALYVAKTLSYITFFDSLSTQLYDRKINQIYLCHDNKLNADYLPQIINLLKVQKFEFISLKQALEDPIYQQPNKYYKKWGISWFYRWMNTQTERVKWMKQEPPMHEIEQLFNQLSN